MKPDVTLALGYLKPCHANQPAANFCGEIIICDIGLPSHLSGEMDTELLSDDYVRPILPARPISSHKGSYGKGMVVGGSDNYIGAPVLAASSAMKTGLGLVTIATFEGLVNPMANMFPEATFPNRPCQLPFRSLWVHHDGAVSSCCRDYHGELIVGDIKNQSIRDVWNGHVLEKLREAHRKGEVKDYRLCDNCFIVDDRIVALFNALMEYLVRKEPYGPAEYYQEKVDRFTEIIQSGGPFEPKFSQPMFVKEILSIR